MSDYKMKTGKIGDAVVDTYKKIENKFTSTFLNEDGSMKTGKIGETITDGYQKIEDAVVGSYKKVEDAFVDAFLEKVDDEKKDASESKE